MPQVHVNVTFETIEEAAAFFGKAKAKGSTTAQTTQTSPPPPPPAVTSGAATLAVTGAQQSSVQSAATTSPSDLPAAQDRARQAYQNYVGRGQGRTAETGKVFMTELGINAGIRNCSDPAVLHALADRFDAS